MSSATAAPTALGLPFEDALDGFARHLRSERSRSPHTQRAYLGDVRSLLGFAAERGVQRPDGITLPLLRSYLAAQTGAGLSRATIARRAASARTFCAWATRAGSIPR